MGLAARMYSIHTMRLRQLAGMTSRLLPELTISANVYILCLRSLLKEECYTTIIPYNIRFVRNGPLG
jgi:hypothetical protein